MAICPICNKHPADADYRPFCSKRCADVDLGRDIAVPMDQKPLTTPIPRDDAANLARRLIQERFQGHE